jgi:N-acetylmuramoyl-L-alanine amidase
MPVWNNTTATNAADVEAQRQQLEALRNKSLETAHASPAPTGLSAFEINPRSMTASTRPIASRMYRHQSAYSRITIHHDGMPPVMLHSQSQNRERIRQIRNLHVNNNGWGDIGYHFIIDRNGQIWEGRPLKWQGAHVRNQNPGNLGVMCLGNFEIESPSHAQLETLTSYVVALATHHRVPLRRIVTHQELASTLCPGRNLQRQVIAARRPRGSIAALL